MCLFIESIKIENGRIFNIDLHNKRCNKTREEFHNIKERIRLEDYITNIPKEKKIYKCRIVYGREIEKIEFIPYVTPKIDSIKVVVNDRIEYSAKYENREQIDLMKKNVDTDDILIVKNGLITDCSFTNIALYDGKKWITPASALLKGTKREQLLQERILEEKYVMIDELCSYKSIRLFNAMIDWGEIELPIDKITI